MPAEINRYTCTNCQACINVCPVGAIALFYDGLYVSEECVSCGLCVNACPNGSVTLDK